MELPDSLTNLLSCAEDHGGAARMAGAAERFFCGQAGLMRSAGQDPRCLRVFSFDKSLSATTASAEESAKKSLLVKEKWRDTELGFDSVEVKFHLGADACDGALD